MRATWSTRFRKEWWLILGVSLTIGACFAGGQSHDEDGHGAVGFAEDGAWVNVYFSFETTPAEIEEVTAVVEDLASDISPDLQQPQFVFDIDPAHLDAIEECYSWAAPQMWIATSSLSIDESQAIVDAIESFPQVVALAAPGLETDLDTPSETGEEEAYIECESKAMHIYLAEEGNLEAVAAEARPLPGVIATGQNVSHEDTSLPDFSEFPDAQECYAPLFFEVLVVFDQDGETLTGDVIEALSKTTGIVGFGGWHVPEELDPTLGFEEEIDWHACGQLELSVELAADINDEDAGLVAARALGIEGVADVNLELVDFESIEPCETVEYEDGSHGDCFTPTNYMVIYRGDAELASDEIIAGELCELPGVMWISVPLEFFDPYLTCGRLELDVYFDLETRDDLIDAAISQILSMGGVITAASWSVEEALPALETVIGSRDPQACDPERSRVINASLSRMTEPEARVLADEIGDLDGVVSVGGNAVGRQAWEPSICGRLGVSIHIRNTASDEQREDLYDLFRGRADVMAVVVEESWPGDNTAWVQVLFSTDTAPSDLHEMAQAASSLSGVDEAEANDWPWEEFIP